jgi:hypothetical protein
MERCMESSMHNMKILQSENPRVPTDRHQTPLSNTPPHRQNPDLMMPIEVKVEVEK